MDGQIKSKKRVTNFGEVNTSEIEVKRMLDLVNVETERLDSRFLEPACGDGNFLEEVLIRKLKILVRDFKKNQFEFEKNSILVVGSIYGIEILEDNASSARERLYRGFKKQYESCFKNSLNDVLLRSVKFILKKNIIHGDALTLMQVKSENPITLSEWAILNSKVKRRDFTLLDLLHHAPFEKNTIFSDLGDEVIIPSPVKEYELIDFYKIHEYEN